jgi:hypothetical protein
VNNNPIRYNDPTGHKFEEDTYSTHGEKCKPGDTSCWWIYENIEKKLKQSQKNKGEPEHNACTGQAPYKPLFTCYGIITPPAGVYPLASPGGGDSSDGVIDFKEPGYVYRPSTGGGQVLNGLDLFMSTFTWLYYNTSWYHSATGSEAQAMIPILHENDNQTNWISGLLVANNTGYNVTVNNVLVDNYLVPLSSLSSSPTIPNGSAGFVRFSNPLGIPDQSNMMVTVNYTASSPGFIGTGSIKYNGPNYLPAYGPYPAQYVIH